MRKLVLLLAIILLSGQQIIAQEPYRVYLPALIVPRRPAQSGAALSGPCTAIDTLGVTWWYRWGGPRECYPSNGAFFVPMVAGRASATRIAERIEMARESSGWLLGYNEPDLASQGNMSPSEGAVLWRQIEEQANGIRLASPAPSQFDPDWLWRMVDEYQQLYGSKPRFDAIAAHYYSWNPPSTQKTKDYLLQVRRGALVRGYDVPIWLTEFAGDCKLPDPENGNQQLMLELIPWLKEQPWIGRYAWFSSEIAEDAWFCPGCQACSLTDPGTEELTELGELYSSF